MEDWNVSTPIQINISGHDAATLGGLPSSFYLNAANLTGTIDTARIPGLDWAKITTGKPTTLSGYGITDALTIAGSGLTSTGNTINAIGTAGRIIVNADSIDLATIGTAGTYTKPTTDAYGRVISGSNLLASDIPSLDASKITTGILASARLSSGVMDFSSPPLYYNSVSSFDLNNLPAGARCLVTQSGNFNVPIGEGFWYVECVTTYTSTTFLQRAYTYASTSRPKLALRQNHNGTWSNWQIFDMGALNTDTLVVNSSAPSTSTTTGALTVAGGVGARGDMYANLFNGHHQLKTYATGAEPTASASTVGQIWLNTTTGKIRYVATASTIQTITSA